MTQCHEKGFLAHTTPLREMSLAYFAVGVVNRVQPDLHSIIRVVPSVVQFLLEPSDKNLYFFPLPLHDLREKEECPAFAAF